MQLFIASYTATCSAAQANANLSAIEQGLKHLLLYDHLLSAGNIYADAHNQYFNASDLTYTGWYRFNVPAVGAPPTTVNSTTTDETTLIYYFPGHVLPTSYAYNSTNQVNLQSSPDEGNPFCNSTC